jgi:hypothetical protein
MLSSFSTRPYPIPGTASKTRPDERFRFRLRRRRHHREHAPSREGGLFRNLLRSVSDGATTFGQMTMCQMTLDLFAKLTARVLVSRLNRILSRM